MVALEKSVDTMHGNEINTEAQLRICYGGEMLPTNGSEPQR